MKPIRRDPHTGLIKRTRANRAPARVLFVDTETYQRQVKGNVTRQELRLGVACFWERETETKPEREEWFNFTDAPNFWEWALNHARPRKTIYMVGHNLKFDLLTLNVLEEIPSRGWYISQLYEKGGTFLLMITYPNSKLLAHLEAGQPWHEFKGSKWARTIRCVDNMNLFPGSLEDLGKSLGIAKLPMPDVNAPDEAWFTYCRRDVEIMVKAWKSKIAFILDNELGSFKTTLASQSFETYRRKFMVQEIRRHRHPQALHLERDAYKGGRSEAFYVGQIPDPPVYKLDVNSLYPHVMASNTYPYELVGVIRKPTVHELMTLVQRYHVIALTDVEIDEPVFPVKTRYRNIYPVGHLSLSLTTPELLYALERGWVKHVYRAALYKHADLFSGFVHYFYRMKQNATRDKDPIARLTAKLMLNSAYGKWGQLGREDRIIGTCDPKLLKVEYGYDMALGVRCTYTYVGGLVIESYETGEATYSFPAIAAHVTANARLYMWWLMLKAGRDNVYYTDTDSLFVSQEGYDRLQDVIDDAQLGALKLEDVGQKVVIHGPKDYTWDGKRTLKGIPAKATQLDPNTWAVMEWPSFQSHIKDSRTFGFHNVTVNKTLHRSVNWGILAEDGRVIPIRFTPGTDPSTPSHNIAPSAA